MKRFRLACLVLVMALALAPSAALAAGRRGVVLTAVGDSIAVGTGATGLTGYVDLFQHHLARVYGTATLLRASYDGMTSGTLLGHLTDPADPYYGAFNGAVAGAGVITVSIGGNDILQTVAGLDPAYVSSLPPDQKALLVQSLSAQLTAHIGEFAGNWPVIVGRMRALNPSAKIFVNTLYNPFRKGDGLYELVDPYVRGINDVIVAGAANPSAGYKVVDVYTKFGSCRNPRKPLVHGVLDPWAPLHPTDRGYKVIYDLLKRAANAG